MRVEIFYTRSGRGLKQDAELLVEVLKQLQQQAHATPLPPCSPFISELSSKWHRFKHRILPACMAKHLDGFQRKCRRWLAFRFINADLIIHLENIHPTCIRPGKTNVLIPNQEWFRLARAHYLQDIDQVLCKTRIAQRCFAGHHRDIHYLGFSNREAARASVRHRNTASTNFLHVAGSSPMKGTSTVIKSWLRHPDWPQLTIVADKLELPTPCPTNIRHLSRLNDTDLEELWQAATFAVIPSEAEGFGQVLIEAMIHGAVVITTDAAPMNELITPDRGYLITYSTEKNCRLGKRYLVNEGALDEKISQILNSQRNDWNAKATNASEWVKVNHVQFIKRMDNFLKDISPQSNQPR